MTQPRKRAPRKAAAQPASWRQEVETSSANAPECNVPECPKAPIIKGLCGGHWATRRDLADKG